MRRRWATLLIATMLLATFTTGCDRSATQEEMRETPREAVERMFRAAVEGDDATFIACFELDDDQRRVMKEIARTNDAVKALREAVLKRYGQEGWGQVGPAAARLRYGGIPPRELSFQIRNNVATVTFPGTKWSMKLVPREGAWKIVTATFPDDEAVNENVRFFRRRAEVLNRLAERVDDPDMTPAILLQQLMDEGKKRVPLPGKPQ